LLGGGKHEHRTVLKTLQTLIKSDSDIDIGYIIISNEKEVEQAQK
jgi:hypothetical protein